MKQVDWKLMIAACIAAAVLGLAMNYAWWSGFRTGADAVACVWEYDRYGDEALNGRSCKAGEGKRPPADIFGMKGE